MHELDDIRRQEIKTARLAWPWRLARALLLAAGVTLLLVLGYTVFWPWDRSPPQDADLRQMQKAPPCAPQDNAWPLLNEAGKKVVTTITVMVPPPTGSTEKPAKKEFYWSRRDDLYSQQPATLIWKEVLANETLKANAAAFSLVDQALSRPAFAFPSDSDKLSTHPFYSSMSPLNELLDLKAIKEQLDGNPAEAAKAILQRLRIGQLFFEDLEERNCRYGSGYMNEALGRLRTLLQEPMLPDAVLEKLATGMKPWDRERATDCFKNFIRSNYQRNADILLDPDRAKSWLGDILGGGHDAKNLPIPAWCFKPNLTCQKLADETRILLAKAGKPNVKFMAGMSTAPYPVFSRKDVLLLLFRKNGLGDFNLDWQRIHIVVSWQNTCSLEAEYAAMRLAIACKRHERKYGKLPENLQALVPEFLPAVPIDPFDGQPFRYAPARRIIYSVGLNGVDDGGVGDPLIWNPRRGLDLVMPLDLPALPPVTRPPPESYLRNDGGPGNSPF